MKNRVPAALVLLFFILATAINACSPDPTPTPASQEPGVTATSKAPSATATTAPSLLSAILSEIAGKVEMKQAAETEFTPAADQSFLDENGQAMTGSDGRLRLDLSTGTIVRLAPDSLFTLVSNEQADGSLKTRLQLTIGKLFVILNGGSLEVDTPTGTAAVRGSYLSVNYDPNSGEVRVTCLEGHCSLSGSGGTVEITAGQTATITGVGQPPLVGEMTEADFQDWLNNNPEAKVLVDALNGDQPSLVPTEVVIRPPFISPPVIKRVESEEEDVVVQPTASPTPTLTPTVEITSVVASNFNPVVGEPFTVNVTVNPSDGGPLPTGKVKAKIDGTYICTATLNSAGNASCVGTVSSANAYELTAVYFGDSKYLPAQSSAWIEFSIDQASTTTTITVQPLNPSQVGVTAAEFTATVDVVAPGAGTPTGQVTFSDGTDNCTAYSAPWSCSITFTSPGTKTVTANYVADVNFIDSGSSPINHDVLAGADAEFRNANPPISPITACAQFYSVDALDVNGVNEVRVEYHLTDNYFVATDIKLPLTKIPGTYTWQGNLYLPVSYPDTAYWRFVATDGAGNETFFGGATAYIDGYVGGPFSAYSYAPDIGVTCP